jgi:hypothetical protein
MVKGRVGRAKAAAAMQRRLDRGARKARRKLVRQSGYWIERSGEKKLRPCAIYAEFGRHHVEQEYDGSWYCIGCFRDSHPWVGPASVMEINATDEYPYYE